MPSNPAMLFAKREREREREKNPAMHTSQAKRTEIPENKVVLCSISNQLVALPHQMVTKGNCVCLDLLDIGLESRLQLEQQSGDCEAPPGATRTQPS